MANALAVSGVPFVITLMQKDKTFLLADLDIDKVLIIVRRQYVLIPYQYQASLMSVAGSRMIVNKANERVGADEMCGGSTDTNLTVESRML